MSDIASSSKQECSEKPTGALRRVNDFEYELGDQTIEQFEVELSAQGYQFDDSDPICDHHTQQNFVLFVHGCQCCNIPLNSDWKIDRDLMRQLPYRDIKWARYPSCRKCLDNYLSCLFCGGHYSALRIFCDGQVVTNANTGDLNSPDQLVYDDDDQLFSD